MILLLSSAAEKYSDNIEPLAADSLAKEDICLLKQIQKGDSQAFAKLVEKHNLNFYKLAYNILTNREEAEDIVQDCFLKLWQKPELWDAKKQSKFTTWFYRIIVNRCLDHHKRKKAIPLEEGYEIEASTDIEAEAHKKQIQKMIQKLLLEIPERQMLALCLSFYQGLSNKESAEILGINIKALESLLVRARANLKKKLKDKSYEELRWI